MESLLQASSEGDALAPQRCPLCPRPQHTPGNHDGGPACGPRCPRPGSCLRGARGFHGLRRDCVAPDLPVALQAVRSGLGAGTTPPHLLSLIRPPGSMVLDPAASVPPVQLIAGRSFPGGPPLHRAPRIAPAHRCRPFEAPLLVLQRASSPVPASPRASSSSKASFILLADFSHPVCCVRQSVRVSKESLCSRSGPASEPHPCFSLFQGRTGRTVQTRGEHGEQRERTSRHEDHDGHPDTGEAGRQVQGESVDTFSF